MKKPLGKTDNEPTREYDVVSAFWDGPHLRAAGETVFKTQSQAKYYEPHILQLKAARQLEGETAAPTSKVSKGPKD